MGLNKRLIDQAGGGGQATWTQGTTYSVGTVGGTNSRVVGGINNTFYKYEYSSQTLYKNTIPSSGSALTSIYTVNLTSNGSDSGLGLMTWDGYYISGRILIWSYIPNQSVGRKYNGSDGSFTGQPNETYYLSNLQDYAFVYLDATTGFFSPSGGHFNGAYYIFGVATRKSDGQIWAIKRQIYSNIPVTNPTVANIDSTLGSYEKAKATMWDATNNCLWIVAAQSTDWYAFQFDFYTMSFIGNPISLGNFSGNDVGSYPAGGWIDPNTNTAYIGGLQSSKLYSWTIS